MTEKHPTTKATKTMIKINYSLTISFSTTPLFFSFSGSIWLALVSSMFVSPGFSVPFSLVSSVESLVLLWVISFSDVWLFCEFSVSKMK